jgi:hypothetical protein
MKGAKRSENERKRAKNKQTLHGNWCVFCNNVLKFYTHAMDSLDENEFCETNVKEGAKRTNDSLSFLFGNDLRNEIIFLDPLHSPGL